jgi:hypothetical protein
VSAHAEVERPVVCVWYDQKSETTLMTTRGRSQDRKRVAGGQDHEVRYEAKKTGTSKGRVNRAIKKAGNSRGKFERELRK